MENVITVYKYFLDKEFKLKMQKCEVQLTKGNFYGKVMKIDGIPATGVHSVRMINTKVIDRHNSNPLVPLILSQENDIKAIEHFDRLLIKRRKEAYRTYIKTQEHLNNFHDCTIEKVKEI